MHLFNAVLLTIAGATPENQGFSLELSIWKYVVVVGVGGAIIAYVVKRIAEIAAIKKTQAMIDSVGEPDSPKPADPTSDAPGDANRSE